MQDQNVKKIEEYSLAGFATALQEAFLEGYRLNLEENAGYPVQIGPSYYVCDVYKPSVQELKEEPKEVQQEETQQVKPRGRVTKK